LSQADAQLAYPYFKTAVKNNPKFSWRWKGGEDAWIISSNQRMISVADGVGGWNNKEVCSGRYARFLCKRMGELYDADNSKTLKDLLYEAAAEAFSLGGSAVVVSAKLEPTIKNDSVKMPALNLGDSAYIILRP